jgi:hypothetical protein
MSNQVIGISLKKLRKCVIVIPQVSDTSKGKPIAILSGVTKETLEKKLRAIRRSLALIALEEMQKKSLELGLDKLTNSEIELQIQAVRKARNRQW